jgi:hypothetical protein
MLALVISLGECSFPLGSCVQLCVGLSEGVCG